LLDQTIAADEIVVVDDASTDNSVEVIRRLISGHPRARLIENPVNKGTYGACELAFATVTSDFVLSLAANDYVFPGIFKCAKDMLAQHPESGIWSAMAELVDDEGCSLGLHVSPLISLKPHYFLPEESVITAFSLGNWFASPTMIFRRDAFAAAGGVNPKYGGLSDLFVALVLAAQHGAAFTPKILGAIRMHPDSFLSKTLGNAGALDALLAELNADGAMRAPELFTPVFAQRFVERVRFAAIRASGGMIGSVIANQEVGMRTELLSKMDTLIPSSWKRLRVFLSFLLLRPYDLLPTVWYRYLGAVWMRWHAVGR